MLLMGENHEKDDEEKEANPNKQTGANVLFLDFDQTISSTKVSRCKKQMKGTEMSENECSTLFFCVQNMFGHSLSLPSPFRLPSKIF